MYKNKKVLYIIISIILFTLVLMAGTYAWFTWTSTNNTDFSLSIGTIADVTFESGQDISIDNLSPTFNYFDGESTSFVVNNKTDNDQILATRINLVINSVDDELIDESFKYTLTRNDTVIRTGNFSDASAGSTIILGTSEIGTGESEFEIYFWIDGNEENDSSMMGKNITGTINVEAYVQNICETGYHVNDNNECEANQVEIEIMKNDSLWANSGKTVSLSTSSSIDTTTFTETSTDSTYTIDEIVSDTDYYIWADKSSLDSTRVYTGVSFTAEANSTQTSKVDYYDVTLTKDDGISSVLAGGTYLKGQTVSVGAVANSGYSFANWRDANSYDLISSNQTYSTLVTKSIELIATSIQLPQNEKVATINYYDGIASATTTVSCTTTDSSCDVTIPDMVINSVGPYDQDYVGLAAQANSMSPTINSSTTTITLTDSATYYATYSSPVSVYYPSSASEVSTQTLYRNSYYPYESNTIIGSISSSTENITQITGLYGTLEGFATSANTTNIVTSQISGISNRNEEEYYLVSSYDNPVTVTFHYASEGSWLTTNASGIQVRYAYLSSGSTVANSLKSDGNITIPSVVLSSGYILNFDDYAGVSSSNNGMVDVTPTTANTDYYAFYSSDVTEYYYNNGLWDTRTLYRNNTYNTGYVLSSSQTGTTNVSAGTGPDSSSWYGLALDSSSTTQTYTSYSDAASHTDSELYSLYQKNSVIYKYQNYYNYLVYDTNYNQIGGSYTLSDAYNMFTGDYSSGGIIQANVDVSDATTLTIASGVSVTLDTNSKTITLTGSTITNNGTLNISENGTIQTSAGISLVTNIGGTVTCEDTTLIAGASSKAMSMTSGNITNTSCTIRKTGNNSTARSAVNLSGGKFIMTGGLIEATGRGVETSSGNDSYVYIYGGEINTTLNSIYSGEGSSGTIRIGELPVDRDDDNRFSSTNTHSNKSSPIVTSSSSQAIKLYATDSSSNATRLRVYNGYVAATGAGASAIRLEANCTKYVVIDGGGIYSADYLAYYNLSSVNTYFTGDAALFAGGDNSAVNSAGNIRINTDYNQSTTGFAGIEESRSDCSSATTSGGMGRAYGTWIVSSSGYGLRATASEDSPIIVSIGSNDYKEVGTEACGKFRNEGATIATGSSSTQVFSGYMDLYWYVGMAFSNNSSSYKTSAVTIKTTSSRNYSENISHSSTLSRTIGGTSRGITTSYISYPLNNSSSSGGTTSTTPPGTKLTTNGTIYAWRSGASSCNSLSACGYSSCSLIGAVASGKSIYVTSPVSDESTVMYYAWVELSSTMWYDKQNGYNQLTGSISSCSNYTYKTNTYGSTKYVKVRMPLKSSECSNSCCLTSCSSLPD